MLPKFNTSFWQQCLRQGITFPAAIFQGSVPSIECPGTLLTSPLSPYTKLDNICKERNDHTQASRQLYSLDAEGSFQQPVQFPKTYALALYHLSCNAFYSLKTLPSSPPQQPHHSMLFIIWCSTTEGEPQCLVPS